MSDGNTQVGGFCISISNRFERMIDALQPKPLAEQIPTNKESEMVGA
jgi:hypothetical protein